MTIPAGWATGEGVARWVGVLLVFLFAAHVPAAPLVYPTTVKTNQVDDYHGVEVVDTYRWLEDDKSAQTKAWVEAESKVTAAYLGQIPERKQIQERLTKLWTYEVYGTPFQRSGRYFFFKNDGVKKRGVLYVADSLAAEPRVLLDPNPLSTDGAMRISGMGASDDGKLLAYGLSATNSDWQEWKVRDVRTGADLPDRLQWAKFSGAAWTKDNRGFYYSRYDEPKAGAKLTETNQFHKLYYHRTGTPQAEDKLVYHRPDHGDWTISGLVAGDGNYLGIWISQGSYLRNRFYCQDLRETGAPVVELVNDFDAMYRFIDNDGPLFWFLTDWQAPLSRVVAIDIRKPERANWREVIPEAAEPLTNVRIINNQFVAVYLREGYNHVKVFALDGTPVREVELPGVGSAYGFSGKRADTETFYGFTSLITPGTVYRYDMKTGASTVFREPRLDFNPGDYQTYRVFFLSRDGMRVPMFIAHRKGLKLDGQNPTLLTGYGGFDISQTPEFSARNLAWMEMGGVFAMPNLRGGGEYGEGWHQAGTRVRKQNVFDDFIAAAEWLIANRYTSPPKLAISGASNGGLLVGACMTQRPELFGACLPSAGVMDMLRFPKFTIGGGWIGDYGSPENANEFKELYAYSPLHNLKPGVKYPPTLVTTGDADVTVVPAHSYKFTARLQECQAGDAPVLIRIEPGGDHGGGNTTAKVIEEAADKLGFLVKELRVKVPADMKGGPRQ